MFRFLYSPYPRTKEAIQDIRRKLEEIYFKPNLAIFFLTGDLINNAEKFAGLVDCNSVCMPVEGYITPESIWTRGCLVLLMDTEYGLHVFRGTPDEVVARMRMMRKGRFNILFYPLLYPKSRLQALKKLIRLKRLYRKYDSDPEFVLEKASEIYERELIYPINKMLRPFRDAGCDAVSFNIFPLRMKYGHPSILVNGRKIGRGVVILTFKDSIQSYFSDTLPRRGNTTEETERILKDQFMVTERVFVEKSRLTVGHINKTKISEFLKRGRFFKPERDVSDDLKKGKFSSATPYGLYFISRKTKGAAALGLLNYPVELYPSLYELDIFYDEAIFFAETVKGGIRTIVNYIPDQEFNFCALDQYLLLMYEDRIHAIKSKISGYGIFTSYPSFTSPNLERGLLSEVEEKLCINVMRTMVFVNWI